MAVTDGRICEACERPLQRREGEKPYLYAKRRTCSRECKNELLRRLKKAGPPPPGRPRLQLEAKTCGQCGVSFTRRADEPAFYYRRRVTCSPECAQAARLKSVHKASRRGVEVRAARRAAKPKPAPRKAAPKIKYRPDPLEARWQPPRRHEPVRLVPSAPVKRCGIHGDVVGVFGCPACNAGQQWAREQRRVTARPNREGGR